MNLRSPGRLIFGVIAAIFIAVAGHTAKAVDPEKAQLKLFYSSLKKLPPGASPYSKVKSLVSKLVTLDPKNTIKLTKFAITRLNSTSLRADYTKLWRILARIVSKSDLPANVKSRIIQQLDPNYRPPPRPFPDPPPQPYPTPES